MTKISKKEQDKLKERVEVVAEKIKVLFSFCIELKKDKELLKKTLGLCNKRKEFAMSAAPLLGACGLDYEEQALESKIRGKRAKALINLIEVLEDTEQERVNFSKDQKVKEDGRRQLKSILGM